MPLRKNPLKMGPKPALSVGSRGAGLQQKSKLLCFFSILLNYGLISWETIWFSLDCIWNRFSPFDFIKTINLLLLHKCTLLTHSIMSSSLYFCHRIVPGIKLSILCLLLQYEKSWRVLWNTFSLIIALHDPVFGHLNVKMEGYLHTSF